MDNTLPWTVVYVDDEEYNLEELRATLAPRLINPIKLFNHASEFLTWIGTTNEKVGAVLIDLIMPDLGGLELIQWCRKHRPDLRPLIIVTGLQDKYSQKQAEDAGADAYLIKPVTIHTLLNGLAELEHNRFGISMMESQPVNSSDLPAGTTVAEQVSMRRHSGISR